MESEESVFGDFDEDDAFDDEVDWDNVDSKELQKLEFEMTRINNIEDNELNRAAAKALVRMLNGES